MDASELEEEYQKLLQSLVDQLQKKLMNSDISQSEYDALYESLQTRAGYVNPNAPGWNSSSSSCYDSYDVDDAKDGWRSSSCW